MKRPAPLVRFRLAGTISRVLLQGPYPAAHVQRDARDRGLRVNSFEYPGADEFTLTDAPGLCHVVDGIGFDVRQM